MDDFDAKAEAAAQDSGLKKVFAKIDFQKLFIEEEATR
jgi:hypothetical protein